MKLHALRRGPSRLVARPVTSSTSRTRIGPRRCLARRNYATLQSEDMVSPYCSTLKRALSLECAGLAALWSVATCRDDGAPRFSGRLRRQAAEDQSGDSHRTPKSSRIFWSALTCQRFSAAIGHGLLVL